MDESSFKCVGGVLYGLDHPANDDEFIYTMTGNTFKYSKKNITWAGVFCG